MDKAHKTNRWEEEFDSILQEFLPSDYFAGKISLHKTLEDFISNLLRQQREELVKEIGEPLKVVLDYVERWNKQDEERNVAEAATELTDLINN